MIQETIQYQGCLAAIENHKGNCAYTGEGEFFKRGPSIQFC